MSFPFFSGSTGFGVTSGNLLFPASTPPSFANSDILVGVSLKRLQVFAFLTTALFVSNPVPCFFHKTFFKQKKTHFFRSEFPFSLGRQDSNLWNTGTKSRGLTACRRPNNFIIKEIVSLLRHQLLYDQHYTLKVSCFASPF